jgi:NADP-dependent 3-hydroxy acid dehydrogenase YdfG
MKSMQLAGKTALVTGGGTGIGAGIALALAHSGCRVAISGRREDKLREVAARASGDGSESVLIRAADVGVRTGADDLVDWATAKLGRVDVLVNSAGINISNRTLEALDPADWDKLLQINATGAYNCIRAVLPQMRQRLDGLIINISSIAGIRASLLGGVAYSASKFAMSALGMCVGLEEKDHGIRVTNVYPGEVETPILDQRPIPVTAEHRARILQPEDIASVIVAIVALPARAHVPEIVIKPTTQAFA